MCDMDLPDPDIGCWIQSFCFFECKVLNARLSNCMVDMWPKEVTWAKQRSLPQLSCVNPPRELGCPLCPNPDTFVDPPPNAKMTALGVTKKMQNTTCFNMQFYWDLSVATGLDPLGDPFDETTCKSNWSTWRKLTAITRALLRSKVQLICCQ